MKKNNNLLKLLNINEESVERFSADIEYSKKLEKDVNVIRVAFKPHTDCCPRCGSVSFRSKGNHTRKLTGIPINDRPAVFITTVKRFICNDCDTSFVETNPIASENSKFTSAAIVSILKRLKHYTATYSKIAQDFGVSAQKIVDIFDSFVRIKRHVLPRVLLVDEFHFSRKVYYKYPAVLMNFENKLIVDIVESRRQEVFSSYLSGIDIEERKKVELICTDMSQNFRSLLNLYFPDATFLVDHFHVTKYVNDQLNNTRKRIMRKYYKQDKSSKEYRALKKYYKILLKPKKDIDYGNLKYRKTFGSHLSENAIREYLLSISDELKMAYSLKEEYLAFDQCDEKYCMTHDKKAELESLIRNMKRKNVPEFIEVADTFKHWKQEILNSFVWIDNRRVSNGPIEGKNNYIKKILGNANGMYNFARARNRIMYSQNQYETVSPVTPHTDSIKIPSEKRGKYNKNKK